MTNVQPNPHRVLLVDDNPAIHEDFAKVLCPNDPTGDDLAELEEGLFGESVKTSQCQLNVTLDSAHQGAQALEMVIAAQKEGNPYALAFVDMRMPPGWDGVETVSRIWEVDDQIQIVFCTAYSDYSWDNMASQLENGERWLILKKPFDNIEVIQMTNCLIEKWHVTRRLEQHVIELEKAVADRTQELREQNFNLEDAMARLQEAHAQLLQSDKMASIGQLAAGVAHEINNPIGFISSNLNSLNGYLEDVTTTLASYDELLSLCLTTDTPAQTLAKRVKDERDTADFDFILDDLSSLIAESMEGAKRVQQIVADLRDFSHVDAPDVSSEDVNALIDKTINVAWNELKYKTEVIREYNDIPLIPCFGGRLGQVFLNLLVNAAHSIAEKGTITIRTSANDTSAIIEIADTGCGIPPENLTRIFDPFFTTKEVGKGTGMGLNLAYKIVQAHGGSITAQSEVGKGTTFRIEIPRKGPPTAAKTQEDTHAC